MSNTAVILLMVGLMAVCFIIRYAVKTIFEKGSDAISNAIADKKNKSQSNETQNLADRYKK